MMSFTEWESIACWNHSISKTLQLSVLLSGNHSGCYPGYRGSTDPSTVTSSKVIFKARWRRKDLTQVREDLSIAWKKPNPWSKTSETCVTDSPNSQGGCWMICRQQGSPVRSLRCRVRILNVTLIKNHSNGPIKLHSMFKRRSNSLRGICEYSTWSSFLNPWLWASRQSDLPFLLPQGTHIAF